MNEKIKHLWEISKEQEERFRESIKGIFSDIDEQEFFALIRGAEYRRGKDEAQIEMRKEFLDFLINYRNINNSSEITKITFDSKIKELKHLLGVKD